MSTQEQIAEQDRNAREHLQQRLDAEAEFGAAQAERQLLAELRAGADTARMRQAIERLSDLNGMARGRWQTSTEGGRLVWNSPSGRALQAVQEAAKEAVAATLVPLLADGQAELEAATKERDEILERGRL